VAEKRIFGSVALEVILRVELYAGTEVLEGHRHRRAWTLLATDITKWLWA
jgi:hypothetical protein